MSTASPVETTSPPQWGPTGPGSMTWIVSVGTIRKLRGLGQDGAKIVEQYFDNPKTMVVCNGPGELPHVPRRAAVSASYASGAALSRHAPYLYYPYKAALLTLDRAHATPSAEQQDPKKFFSAAAGAVHVQRRKPGLAFVSTPGANLVASADPQTWKGILSSGLVGACAAVSQVYTIQAQDLWKTAGSDYIPYVEQAAQQARSANPAVQVVATLSTNPPSGNPTAGELYEIVVQTRALVGGRPIVDGFWLDVPDGGPGTKSPSAGRAQPRTALQLLQMLRSRG